MAQQLEVSCWPSITFRFTISYHGRIFIEAPTVLSRRPFQFLIINIPLFTQIFQLFFWSVSTKPNKKNQNRKLIDFGILFCLFCLLGWRCLGCQLRWKHNFKIPLEHKSQQQQQQQQKGEQLLFKQHLSFDLSLLCSSQHERVKYSFTNIEKEEGGVNETQVLNQQCSFP